MVQRKKEGQSPEYMEKEETCGVAGKVAVRTPEEIPQQLFAALSRGGRSPEQQLAAVSQGK